MFPEDLRYTDKHEWVRAGNGDTVRIGITSFAAEALGDIVYITLPQVGEEVAAEDTVAEVESTKNVSEVYAPLSGVITAVNEQLTDAPDTVNADPFGDGWLFEMELTDPGQLDDLLDADGYAAVAGE
ncbi:glycine cleavage system protein GcvH [Propioniciclava coleopterorum]|uniref:glycine cleavage system protein GcvH n=1 Tax=Propioniciclava coleopterorum TaxID=2714937 RepID=UPI001FEA6CE4|nr:glycine cleavage system protein GcvH [Propioniciclava coleopterorum]